MKTSNNTILITGGSTGNSITRYQPDVIVIPAGGAKFDLGGETTKHQVIANHLESLDHCPVTRAELSQEVLKRSWEKRFHIPRDGETVLI